MISINDKNELIYLGVQGETEARIVEFDFEDWIQQYGSGTLELLAQRNGEKTAYPVNLTFYGNIAVWNVSDIDNALAGFGRCQLRYKVNDVIVKTAIFKTMTDVALGNTDEPGNPYQDILDALEEAEEAAEAVLDLSVDAETLECGADASVEKQVDPETGEINLHFGIPTGPQGSPGPAGHDGKDGVDGKDGSDGKDGQDGHSPVITASKAGKVTTIYSDDTAIGTVNDGQDGQDGQDGSDYILTNQDKQDIADIVIAELPTWTGGQY